MSAAHLDYETLADLAEGILDDARTASAAAHLSDCATCQEREAELGDVSRMLAEVPAPSVPPELISRIDEALAAAATEQPAVEHPRWRRAHLVLAAAAAAGVVAVGGVTFLQTTATDTAPAQSSAERAKQPPAVTDARPEAATPEAPASQSGYPPLSTSGTNYRESELAGQVVAVTERADARGAAGAGGQGAGGPLSQRLTSCIDRISKGRVPVLIDLARYEDAPATVIVFPGKSQGLDVWVTGPGCGHDASDVIEHTEISP